MKTYLTQYGKTWDGGNILAKSFEDAETIARIMKVEVVGELVEEIEL